MKKSKLFSFLFVLSVSLLMLIAASSCRNYRVKHLGGSATYELPANQKLVNATWKDANLWYLTRPMRLDEQAETYTFQEKSNIGVLQGTIIFKESKTAPPVSLNYLKCPKYLIASDISILEMPSNRQTNSPKPDKIPDLYKEYLKNKPPLPGYWRN